MTEPTAQLYLIAPPFEDPRTFAPRLEAALSGGRVACVLLPAVDMTTEDALAKLVRTVQAHGAAALLATTDWDLARRLEVDGVHVDSLEALPAAIRRFKPDGIVGAGRLPTRDHAMTAGESGVDYVMLGDAVDGFDTFDDRLERVAWWAEIFQVPCVAVAARADEIAPLAATGVEFVGLGDVVWADPGGPASAVNQAARTLAEGYAAFVARQSEPVG